jgi:hypothetical protein
LSIGLLNLSLFFIDEPAKEKLTSWYLKFLDEKAPRVPGGHIAGHTSG